jgi:hypothetical protein
MSGTFDGGCACGAVRYRMTSAPMAVHCCHCSDCQRQTGSAFVLNALIETMPPDNGAPPTLHPATTRRDDR